MHRVHGTRGPAACLFHCVCLRAASTKVSRPGRKTRFAAYHVAQGHFPLFHGDVRPTRDLDAPGLAEVLSFTQQPGPCTMDITNQVRPDITEGRNRSRFRLTGNRALLLTGLAGQCVFEDAALLRVTVHQ